jgi:hypothetical protein
LLEEVERTQMSGDREHHTEEEWSRILLKWKRMEISRRTDQLKKGVQ